MRSVALRAGGRLRRRTGFAAVAGMWLRGESVPMAGLVSIGPVLAGVIGLNLSGVTPP
ncbi:MAG TPA: hypothetical protein VKV38_12085 [Trebonia sp.]|nr:hypothetical protein [Trebonia sp.]